MLSGWPGPEIERFNLMRLPSLAISSFVVPSFVVPSFVVSSFVVSSFIFAAVSSTVAHAAPVCASTASQIENSQSELLKEILSLLRDNKHPGLANNSKGSFLTTQVAGQLGLAYHSTTNGLFGKEYEYRDGTLEVCDNHGKLSLKSPAFGDRELEVTVADGCFQIHHAWVSKNAGTFCPDTMPAEISIAKTTAETLTKSQNQRASQ